MEGNSDDRISKLPEPILHHIMSFLHVTDAARMSTLSKVSDSAWNSLPYLNFDDIFYWWSKDLNVVIDQTLASRKKHKISMQRFSLWLGHYHRLSYVDRWIKILIACNIKELNLRVDKRDYQGSMVYSRLPEAIFAAKSLNVLSLYGSKIELPADNGTIKLSSLRELHFTFVFLDEQFIKAMCTSCGNLEHLFQGTHQLSTINLEDLRINNLNGHIKVVRITACKALKSLYLNYVDITDNWIEELLYSLQNLEKFELTHCKTLKNMKIASDSLKELCIRGCDNLIAVDLDAPNVIKICCFKLAWIEESEKGQKVGTSK
ncbi:hypothetical protein FXO38_22762 [Capsicum annuum]|nr:hypothetical protein FXO38_22762 [Capsicum annuum]KAF3651139.1 hypothetical protein FXO37_18153 [Capsicum annuum]